jgi:hypothetical protein
MVEYLLLVLMIKRLVLSHYKLYDVLTLVGISLFLQEDVIMRRNHLTLELFVIILLGITLQACGSIQQLIQGTPTFLPTMTLSPSLTPSQTPTATSTLTPTITPSATITPNLTATQQYEDFVSLVQKFHEAGQITTTEGDYKKLDDFSDELAMEYGYQWSPTGRDSKDFIIRAVFDWEVANQKNYSGCGYMFRQESESHSYMIALDALNGVFFTYTQLGSLPGGPATVLSFTVPAAKRSRLPDLGNNPYHAIFTLIVNEFKAYTYVNDEFFTEHNLKHDTLTDPGPLSFMVLAGSATDFGTRCNFSNVEIWIPAPS